MRLPTASVPSREDAASPGVAPPRSPPSSGEETGPKMPQDAPESATIVLTPPSGSTEGEGAGPRLSLSSRSHLPGGRRVMQSDSRPTSRESHVSWDPAIAGGRCVSERQRPRRQRSLLGLDRPQPAPARAALLPTVPETGGGPAVGVNEKNSPSRP